MGYNKDIVEKLSQFNNLSFTKKQWDIILKGCECPKSSHFWVALKATCIQKDRRIFTLVDIDDNSFNIVWNTYCKYNRENVKKCYNKKKLKKIVEDRRKNSTNITLYLVNGCLTEFKPSEE